MRATNEKWELSVCRQTVDDSSRIFIILPIQFNREIVHKLQYAFVSDFFFVRQSEKQSTEGEMAKAQESQF